MDEEQKKQQNQYTFPYHYIPKTKGDRIDQYRYWNWGYKYITGIQKVIKVVDSIGVESVVDVGCGDGRFLAELKKSNPEIDVLGIDYSTRAIKLANAMNQDIEYVNKNILKNSIEENFECATLIEVLEHIPPSNVKKFLYKVSCLLSDEGKVVLTVPHSNQPVNEKHYQHFDEEKITEILSNIFEMDSISFFDRHSKVLSLLEKALKNDIFMITNKKAIKTFTHIYKNFFLEASESNCHRMLVVCRSKS